MSILMLLPIHFSFGQYFQVGNKLVGIDSSNYTNRGISVSISGDGNTAVAGGPTNNNGNGAIYIYKKNKNEWTQSDKIIGTGNIGAAFQGWSVAISTDGKTIIFGGWNDDKDKGAAWIYFLSGETWIQQAKLVGNGAVGNAQQGTSVAISANGNTALVGAYNDSEAGTGAAWVFQRNGSTWEQQGEKLVGNTDKSVSNQGISVSLSADGNTAAIGGYIDNFYKGACWIFNRKGETWLQQIKLTSAGNSGAARFGNSVSLSGDGNTLLIGGPLDNDSTGATWVFVRTGDQWNQQGEKLVGTSDFPSSLQGNSVSLSSDGTTAVIGGPMYNNNHGAFWVFFKNGNKWIEKGPFITSDNQGRARAGYSVAVSANGNAIISGGLADAGNIGASWIFFNYRPVVLNYKNSLNFVSNTSLELQFKIESHYTLKNVNFIYKRISNPNLLFQITPIKNEDIYSFTIPASNEEIGYEYSLTAVDSAENISNPIMGLSNASWLDPGLKIPYNSFGKDTLNYRIISFPVEMQDASIEKFILINNLNSDYDKKKWRIAHFNNESQSHIEFKNGLNNFQPGKGYWFVVKNNPNKEFLSGPGKSVSASIEKPFSIKLNKGWNQIGNPYNFSISWTDIKNYIFNDPDLPLKVKRYEGKWSNSDRLNKMEGGFIYADKPSILYFPTIKNTSVQTESLRVGDDENSLSNEEWEVNFVLKNTFAEYSLGGLGMNKQAILSKDKFDDLTPPQIGNFIELNFPHSEYTYTTFTKDITHSSDNFIWDLEVVSSHAGNTQLTWNNNFNENFKSLKLYDIELQKIVDMKKHNIYFFNLDKPKKFKVYFGSVEFINEELKPSRSTLGNSSPNPFTNSTIIPFSIAEDVNISCPSSVELAIFNPLGNKVKTIFTGSIVNNFYEMLWDGKNSTGEKVPPGMYIIHLIIYDKNSPKHLYNKVIVN